MSNSSVQPDYLTISSNTSYVLGDTITINPSSSGGVYTISGNTMDTVSFTSGAGYSSGNFTIGAAGSSAEYIWKIPKEFIDCMPDIARIDKMCKEYPGLAIAFEKFKTTYYLVKDEYDNPKDKK